MKIPPLWICFLVIVILLALIVYVSTHKTGVKESVSQFVNNEPKSLFVRLVAEFGPPQILINQNGGFAMWFPSKVYENSPYESVILKDETVNFLYTTIIIDIADYKMKDVLTISKNVYYHKESKEFTVKSDSIVTNKHILISVLKYITDPNPDIQKIKDKFNKTWVENVLDNTPFASTTFSDKYDDDIMEMIHINIPYGVSVSRVNRELMLY